MNWWESYKDDIHKAFKTHHNHKEHSAQPGKKIHIMGSKDKDHHLDKHFEDSKLFIHDF